VLTGYNTLEQLQTAQPDVIVAHLGELRALLEQSGLELPPRQSSFSRRSPAAPRPEPPTSTSHV
jgi:hypothetical protein